MKVFFRMLIVAFCALFLFSAIPALAQKTPDELAKESEDACAASASTKPTPQMVIDKVEKVKETLKTVIHDLNTLVDSVKLAAKEKRASEKEVEAARATLKKLQQVSL